MKYLKKISASTEIVDNYYDVTYYETNNDEITFKKRKWDTTQVFYKIDGTTLYLRATAADGYSERVMYEDATSAKTGWFNAATKGDITTCVIEEDIVPSACTRMFDRMTSLATFENFDKLHVDNATSMFAMFQSGTSLVSLDLSQWNVSKVNDMANMFNLCYILGSLGDISNWDVSNVTNMTAMFSECYKLIVLNLSNWDTSKATDMTAMIGDDKDRGQSYSLQAIKLGNWNVSNVTSYSNFVKYIDSLIDIYLSSTSTSLEWIEARCVKCNVQDKVTIHFGDTKYRYKNSAWVVVD